jgi:protein subunit release factor B
MNSCFVTIRAGSGGKESEDWAQMVSRMYMKFTSSKG